MILKVRILPFLTTFTQLTARLKNFLSGWLLILGLKEGLVECATVCVKSEVILTTVCHCINRFFLNSIKNETFLIRIRTHPISISLSIKKPFIKAQMHENENDNGYTKKISTHL